MSDRKHWFCFSFEDNEYGRRAVASAYVGYPENVITKPRIDEAKKAAVVSDNAVLTSVVPLGYMTRSQFLGDSPLPQEQTNE